MNVFKSTIWISNPTTNHTINNPPMILKSTIHHFLNATKLTHYSKSLPCKSNFECRIWFHCFTLTQQTLQHWLFLHLFLLVCIVAFFAIMMSVNVLVFLSHMVSGITSNPNLPESASGMVIDRFYSSEVLNVENQNWCLYFLFSFCTFYTHQYK